MGKLDNKVAVVTGATEGIGLAVAKTFIQEGAFVFITGRRAKELADAVRTLGTMALGVQGDVAKIADIEHLYDVVAQQKGQLDIVVANAGLGDLSLLENVDEDLFDRLFNVNVKGALFTIQKAIPLLRKGSSIIITGSVAGSKGTPGMGVYGATKAAVRSFVRTLTVELADRNIRANVLSPGPIQTPLMDRQPKETMHRIVSSIPMGRIGEADEVAKAALFLACDDSSFTTGTEIFVDGGRAQI
jgi:NAD(P)-dependent dehydrogenase (short-subunit alcohol dehydrogenase family)